MIWNASPDLLYQLSIEMVRALLNNAGHFNFADVHVGSSYLSLANNVKIPGQSEE